jgi:hypothetical protein
MSILRNHHNHPIVRRFHINVTRPTKHVGAGRRARWKLLRRRSGRRADFNAPASRIRHQDSRSCPRTILPQAASEVARGGLGRRPGSGHRRGRGRAEPAPAPSAPASCRARSSAGRLRLVLERAHRMRRRRLQATCCSCSPPLCIPGFRKRRGVVKYQCGEIEAPIVCQVPNVLSARAERLIYGGVTKMTCSKTCRGRIGIAFFEVRAQAGGTTANGAGPSN